MLKYKYAKKDDIDEKYRDLYSEVSGEWILSGISGVKTQDDIDRLQNSLTMERNDHKETKAKLGKFGDLDATEVLAKLDRIDELEAAQGDKIDESKINEMVETRLKTKMAPLQREITDLTGKLTESDKLVVSFKEKDTQRIIYDHIRKAAVSAKLRDTAVDDALVIGEKIFHVDESGRVVTKDEVGVTPGVDAAVWLTEVKTTRPHWWPESSGAGATGGSGTGSASNPFSFDGWNMTQQGQLLQSDRAKAEQMAKSAGTVIGGPKPKPK